MVGAHTDRRPVKDEVDRHLYVLHLYVLHLYVCTLYVCHLYILSKTGPESELRQRPTPQKVAKR